MSLAEILIRRADFVSKIEKRVSMTRYHWRIFKSIASGGMRNTNRRSPLNSYRRDTLRSIAYDALILCILREKQARYFKYKQQGLRFRRDLR